MHCLPTLHLLLLLPPLSFFVIICVSLFDTPRTAWWLVKFCLHLYPLYLQPRSATLCLEAIHRQFLSFSFEYPNSSLLVFFRPAIIPLFFSLSLSSDSPLPFLLSFPHFFNPASFTLTCFLGGALSTWNQPFEVMRIEVGRFVAHNKLSSVPLNFMSTSLPLSPFHWIQLVFMLILLLIFASILQLILTLILTRIKNWNRHRQLLLEGFLQLTSSRHANISSRNQGCGVSSKVCLPPSSLPHFLIYTSLPLEPAQSRSDLSFPGHPSSKPSFLFLSNISNRYNFWCILQGYCQEWACASGRHSLWWPSRTY